MRPALNRVKHLTCANRKCRTNIKTISHPAAGRISTANKIRRQVIKAIDEAIADVCKKLFENETPELQPHDHDPSPRPPISPSESSPSESSDDSESISCGSLQQATTWFAGDEGDTIENGTCDSAAETLSEEVMIFPLGSLSQACTSPGPTSPPDSPENSSGHDADNESISPELIRRYSLGGGDYQDSNRSHTALISNSQYAQLSQATLNRDEVR